MTKIIYEGIEYQPATLPFSTNAKDKESKLIALCLQTLLPGKIEVKFPGDKYKTRIWLIRDGKGGWIPRPNWEQIKDAIDTVSVDMPERLPFANTFDLEWVALFLRDQVPNLKAVC